MAVTPSSSCSSADLRAVAQPGAELERALAQDRLEHVLVDEDAHGRAEALDALVELLDVDAELAAGERLDGDDAAGRAVHLERLRADPLARVRPGAGSQACAAGSARRAGGSRCPRGARATSDGTPWWPSSIAVVSPTRLPPTIRTWTSSAARHGITLRARAARSQPKSRRNVDLVSGAESSGAVPRLPGARSPTLYSDGTISFSPIRSRGAAAPSQRSDRHVQVADALRGFGGERDLRRRRSDL